MNEKIRRQTQRKGLILQAFADEFREQPVVLEELRWRVFLAELNDASNTPTEMSRSYRNSFARTIREHLPSLTMHKYDHPEQLAVGILSRAIAYRCDAIDMMKQIERTESVSIFLDLKMPRSVEDNLDRPFIARVKQTEGVGYLDMRKMIYSWVYLGTDGNQLVEEALVRRYRYETDSVFRACLPCNKPLTVVAKSRKKPEMHAPINANWHLYQQVRGGHLVRLEPESSLRR
jgi:hypothetical protein